MSKPRKVNFDADLYFRRIRGKAHCKRAEVFDVVCDLTGRTDQTVKKWFKEGLIPPASLKLIELWESGEVNRKKGKKKKDKEPENQIKIEEIAEVQTEEIKIDSYEKEAVFYLQRNPSEITVQHIHAVNMARIADSLSSLIELLSNHFEEENK